MTDRFGLSQETIARIQAVLGSHPEVERAVLYGSRAKGTYKNGSDIDLALQGGDELTMDVLFRIMAEIDDLLLPYSFDLSLYRQITDASLLDHITRVGVTFHSGAGRERQAKAPPKKKEIAP